MRKVLYTKFSRERRNEFQIMTRITEEDGIRRVWKLSLQKEGELHIRHMYENYRKLEHLYTYAGVQICPCELDEEKCALAFPFVEGESLETRISRHGKEKDFASLKKDYELLYQIIASAKGQKSFVETDAFCEVFGHPALKEGLATQTFFWMEKRSGWQTTSGYSRLPYRLHLSMRGASFYRRRRVH